jgi:hypothetical protein
MFLYTWPMIYFSIIATASSFLLSNFMLLLAGAGSISFNLILFVWSSLQADAGPSLAEMRDAIRPRPLHLHSSSSSECSVWAEALWRPSPKGTPWMSVQDRSSKMIEGAHVCTVLVSYMYPHMSTFVSICRPIYRPICPTMNKPGYLHISLYLLLST